MFTLGNSPAKDVVDQQYIANQINQGAVPVGDISVRMGALPPGYLALGEGGSYSRAVYPQLAAWMDVNGTSLGLSPTDIANGILPDWQGYSPRTVGGLGPSAEGQKQEDAMQGHFHGSGYSVSKPYSSGSTIGDYLHNGNPPFRTDLGVREPITDGVNGTPRIALETRGKSFGIRWKIKAYGQFVNTGSVDLVAIQQAQANMVRTDVQVLSDSQKAQFYINTGINKEYINSYSLAGVTAVSQNNLSIYDTLYFEIDFFAHASNAQYILARVSTDNGTTFRSAADNYYIYDGYEYSAGFISSYASTQSGLLLSPSVYRNERHSISGRIRRFNKTEPKKSKSFGVVIRDTGNLLDYSASGSMVSSYASACNAIQFLDGNGNAFQSGTLKLWGTRR